MHFAWELTVNPVNTASNPAYIVLSLPCGVLRKFSIYFDYGCDRLIRAALFDGALQILPTNPDGFYALDGDTVHADHYYDLDEKDNNLIVYGWSVGSKYSHRLTIMADIQGPEEPTLLGVMKAQVELLNKLIDWVKGFI